ncbi:MAG TPA: nitroreductase family protein [Candidatus Nitrosocosmicus sp.]|nr:nitroreductase family protein [Candidatus Nitrosocosmicus sp.]
MSFREFTANILSIRDYEETRLRGIIIADIMEYLREINDGIGKEKGFSLDMMINGKEVFSDLNGVGGYSGVMIRSPHYIGLVTYQEDTEAEFLGAYYMQSVVKKLYDMTIGSCWINITSVPKGLKMKLLKNDTGSINYLLALGLIDETAVKEKAAHTTVTNASPAYKQDPYGTKINEAADSDKARHSLGEIVYLHEWGKQATYEELERRGVADIFFYVRNAPSYKNLQPCRLILKDGEAELAVLNPENEENYIDAGIMMYTLEGLAKDIGIPSKWHFVKDESNNKEYGIVAKIEL